MHSCLCANVCPFTAAVISFYYYLQFSVLITFPSFVRSPPSSHLHVISFYFHLHFSVLITFPSLVRSPPSSFLSLSCAASSSKSMFSSPSLCLCFCLCFYIYLRPFLHYLFLNIIFLPSSPLGYPLSSILFLL